MSAWEMSSSDCSLWSNIHAFCTLKQSGGILKSDRRWNLKCANICFPPALSSLWMQLVFVNRKETVFLLKLLKECAQRRRGIQCSWACAGCYVTISEVFPKWNHRDAEGKICLVGFLMTHWPLKYRPDYTLLGARRQRPKMLENRILSCIDLC